MTEPPTIQQALAAVMADVRKVSKSGTNAAQHFNFRGIDAVLNHVGPALRDHKVVIRPEVTDLRYERVVVGDRKAAVQVLAFVTYEFVGPAGDSLAAKVVGEAIDYGDKGVSKAMSVALRTALIQALALPTGDPEPDRETYQRAAEPATQPQPRVVHGRKSAHSPEGNRPAGDDAPINQKLLARLHITLKARKLDTDRDAALAYYAETVGHPVASSKDLTMGEASKVVKRMEAELAQGTDVPRDQLPQAEPDPTLDDDWEAES